MKLDLFRSLVLLVVLGFAVVVIHDIYAKRSFEDGVDLSTELRWKRENDNWRKGYRDTQPTHNEVEIEYRATHKPDTWLF